MEVEFTNKKIKFEKELNSLDNFVIDFTKTLNELEANYVIISGYIAILFGRSRGSEDVDMFLTIDFNKFEKLWARLMDKFWCINAFSAEEAYNDYLSKGSAVRFAYKNEVIPNMEVKFPRKDIDYFSLKEKIKIDFNNNIIYTSPLELQIAFKLKLGSDKDIEDAAHLYHLFKNKLDLDILDTFFRKLNIPENLIKKIK